jgi:hypothetical protein
MVYVNMGKDLKQNVKYTIQIPEHSALVFAVEHTEHLRTSEATNKHHQAVTSPLQSQGRGPLLFFIFFERNLHGEYCSAPRSSGRARVLVFLSDLIF